MQTTVSDLNASIWKPNFWLTEASQRCTACDSRRDSTVGYLIFKSKLVAILIFWQEMKTRLHWGLDEDEAGTRDARRVIVYAVQAQDLHLAVSRPLLPSSSQVSSVAPRAQTWNGHRRPGRRPGCRCPPHQGCLRAYPALLPAKQ